MKTEPEYISRAQRSREAWAKSAAILDLPADVLREVYLKRFFAPIQARDFHDLVARGEFKRDYVMQGTSIEEVQADIAKREAERVAKGHPKFTDEEIDNGDRLNFQAKAVLEIGDYWESDETKTYLSGGEYITKGKRYKITDFKDEGFGEFTIVTTTNLPGADNRHWVSCHGVKRLFRRRKLIWDWKAAWVRDWNAHHPENLYPVTAEDLALFAELGWPQPPVPSVVAKE